MKVKRTSKNNGIWEILKTCTTVNQKLIICLSKIFKAPTFWNSMNVRIKPGWYYRHSHHYLVYYNSQMWTWLLPWKNERQPIQVHWSVEKPMRLRCLADKQASIGPRMVLLSICWLVWFMKVNETWLWSSWASKKAPIDAEQLNWIICLSMRERLIESAMFTVCHIEVTGDYRSRKQQLPWWLKLSFKSNYF